MDFLHAAVALLASMVLVLAGMVGWLYWQQTRLFQNMNSIVMVIGEIATTRSPPPPPAVAEAEPSSADIPSKEEEDDRASVEDHEQTEIIEGALDTDTLEGKTKKELAEILTKRGIPFGKNESKTALISLLKATA